MDKTNSVAKRLHAGIEQGAFLILAALALGVLFNAIQPRGLRWGTPWTPARVNVENLPIQRISLEEARALQQAERALFLDARDPIIYQEGHIAGAVNVPPQEVDAYVEELHALADSGIELISYCDGVDCPLGAELALALMEHGIPSVKVLVDGWGAWSEAGYPAENP